MSSPHSGPLPNFDRPPVIETSLGFDFEPIDGWSIPHFGLYWAGIRDRYPNFQVHPPADRATDWPVDAIPPTFPSLQLLTKPVVRCWFLGSGDTRLLQVQSDKFFLNWRKLGEGQTYPRYPSLKPDFEAAWRGFTAFLQNEGLANPAPQQCEVSYVNHLVRGVEWTEFSDLSRVTPLWNGATNDAFLPAADAGTFAVRYRIPEFSGFVHVQLRHALRTSDRREVLEILITARLSVDSGSDPFERLDQARDQVVRTFASVTSPAMHAQWGRTA